MQVLESLSTAANWPQASHQPTCRSQDEQTVLSKYSVVPQWQFEVFMKAARNGL
jgi:hypothetical protein